MDEKEKKQLEKASKTDAGKLVSKVTDFFKDLRGEFNKVVWPSIPELRKQTITVIITSILIGAIICGFDVVFSFGHDMLMKLS